MPETTEALSELEVCADDRGAPYARRRGERLRCDLSLSHRAGAALCAIGGARSRIGCDIEWVEPRSRAFALLFLTAGERGWLESLPAESRAEAANLLWSARESVVKALGTGLDIEGGDLDKRFRIGEVQRLRAVTGFEPARHQLGSPGAVRAEDLPGVQSFERGSHHATPARFLTMSTAFEAS